MEQYTPSQYDFVGIGFGPSHMGLAIALDEMDALSSGKLNVHFLEQAAEPSWHPGMLLDGSHLQISFLKDLVTLRNPMSRFSYLQYLKEIGRLEKFINLHTFYPARLEFSQYLQWVGRQFNDYVRYRAKVSKVLPVYDSKGNVEALDVTWTNLQTEQQHSYRTKALSVACGRTPRISPRFTSLLGDRVFHSSAFLHKIAPFAERSEPLNIAIIGGGQSSLEILEWFMSNRPDDKVTCVSRHVAYRPFDDSPFANEVFFSEFENIVYNANPAFRQQLLESLTNTTYNSGNLMLLKSVYRRLYELELKGIDNIRLMNCSDAESIEATNGGYQVGIRDMGSGAVTMRGADIVVLATGYETHGIPVDISEIDRHLVRDEQGILKQSRDFQVMSTSNFLPRLYMMGYGQHLYGISDTLLSLVPFRAERITRSLLNMEPVAEAAPAMTSSLGRHR